MLTRIRRDDGGFVLVVVLLALFAVLMLMTAVMSYAVGSQNLSHRDQNWNAALAAAEAGIDDYLFHLNQDGSYWQYGNNTVPVSDSRYGPAPPDGNQAFTTWVRVPGPVSDAWYRYDRNNVNLSVDGTIKVTSTGRVGNVTRSIDATLRHRNFLDFLYFTDFETKDPAAYDSGDDYTPTQAQTYCAKHYYQGRDISGRTDFAGDTDGPVCTEISFISQDTINGPLHSNDALRMSGSPHFNGSTTTSYNPATGNRWVGSGTPVFAKPGDPKYADPLTMPPSNITIKNETEPALGGTGCLFTGPTAISLRSDGTMDVISPFTRAKNCTVTSNPATSLYSRFTITNMALPANGVIYVQNVPSSSGDPNYTNGCPSPFNNQEAIGGTGASNPNRGHPLGFPQKNDSTSSYACRNGDVFIQGTLHGRLTIAAENNVVVFGSTAYSGSTDLLGLVANNYIDVYHAVSTLDERQTVTVSNWGSGDRFKLTFGGQTTGYINYGAASASAVQTALEALSTIDPGDVTVTGAEGGPYSVTFDGQYRSTDVNSITFNVCSGCSGSVAETYKGGSSSGVGIDGTGVTCDSGGTQGGYCNLKMPGLLSSSTTPSLFSGTTPGTSTMATTTGQYANRGPSISAALVTVAHSFRVQNYDVGPDFATYGTAESKLTISGAIAQRYRGPVGTFSGSSLTSGYAKNYGYDQRLKYDSPPKFLDPVASAWEVVTWAERVSAYAWNAA